MVDNPDDRCLLTFAASRMRVFRILVPVRILSRVQVVNKVLHVPVVKLPLGEAQFSAAWQSGSAYGLLGGYIETSCQINQLL